MVVVHATQGKKYIDIPTDIYCYKYQFSDGKINDRHMDCDGLNAMLLQVISDIQHTEIDAFRKDVDMTVQRIYAMYFEHLNASLPLVEFTESVLAVTSNRRQVTKDKYMSVVRSIDRFSSGICLEDIDITFLNRLETHMLGLGNSQSTVWSSMKVLRTMFNEAVKRDLMKVGQNPFRLYEIPELRYRTDVLRFAEIEELMNYDFSRNTEKKYANIRDIFCFACFTGLRISDLLRLRDDNISKVGDVTWLRIKTQKTGAYVQIPLSIIFYGYAMDILRKYGGVSDMIRYCDRTGPDRAVKKMFRLTGIGGSQHITMHTARRSCITALADFGVNLYTIQKLVGHMRPSTTAAYMQLSTMTIENELSRVFDRDTLKDRHEVICVRRNGQKLYADSEFLRCRNCAFFGGGVKNLSYQCHLHKKKMNVYDWCRQFKEKN